MDIISSDFKKGIVKLRITDADDLWYLSHLIDAGDFVKGFTTRKIKIGDGDNATVVKKPMILKIEAETIDFGSGGLSVRVNGKIKEGPEDIPRDSYHAISLEEGNEFTLEKAHWMSYQKQKLEEASEKKFHFLMCLFDREEALFALTKKFGYEILVRIKGDVEKKSRDIEIKKDFHKEIIDMIESYNQRYAPEKIIIASPAFYKDILLKKITQDFKHKIVIAICSDVSKNSIDEVLKRPELKEVLKNSRTREEQLLVDELLSEINKDHLAVYGWKEVKVAIDAGAVKILMITDEFIAKHKESGTYNEVDEKMKAVDALQGKIHIISSEHEGGKKLNGLSGIAAILRYKLV
ncbi:mRNA surveillance protein pelota [Candidatus Woesearchaeota archaeon CG10_big_fil_rev_8_21_14_0_10_32_24]|nr:MAG: mRNA surveillance protein pelota [Candidatus Woesearchaeota archaeon CG10_big_fil_rev_8_21_14_0_10_32_24]